MRTLKFIVNGQTIERDPKCDFGGLFPGTENYIRLEFSFSPEWNGYAKVASFYSMFGREYEPQVLKDGISCMVPAKALARRSYKVQIIGKRSDGTTITTEKVTVHQNGGNT